MPDAATIARNYLQTWNEPRAEQRRSILSSHWSDGATYVDPLTRAAGREQIAEMVSAVQQRFPGFRFELTGTPNGYGDYVRLSWSLGPEGAEPPIEGSDVIRLREGKIDAVIGFIDRAPAAG